MSLLDEARECVRVTSTMTDAELQMWIDAAIADMRRCGVKDELLEESTMNSLARSAVICFVKGQYGYDNSEAPRFLDSYRLMLAALLNSKSNEYLFPTEEEDSDSDTGTDADSATGTDDGTDSGVGLGLGLGSGH